LIGNFSNNNNNNQTNEKSNAIGFKESNTIGFKESNTIGFKESKLVVYNVSRFSRNVSKGLELARKMRNYRLHLVSSTEMIDVSSPSGEFNLTGLLNAAEFESKLIGKRVKDALEKKKADGNMLGQPPFGFQVEKID